MAHTEQKLINGVLTDVTVFDSSAQEIDDAAAKGLWLANPNLLDNWFFANPVNQRGASEYAATGYTIDRWRATNANTTVTVTDSGITITGASGAVPFLQQVIETPKRLLGRTVTLSALTKGGTLYTATGNIPSILPTSYSFYCVVANVFDVLAAPSTLAVRLKASTGGSNDFVAVKLELGSNQTLAHQDSNGDWALNDPPPNKAAELARCKRYFASLRGDRTANYANFGMGVATSATQAYFLIPFETQMRISPSVTFSGSMRLSVNGGASTIAVTKITSGGQETAGVCRLSATVASGLTQGDVCVLQANNDTTADIWLDANL